MYTDYVRRCIRKPARYFFGLVRARTSSIEKKRYESHQIPQVTYNLSEVLIDNATKKLSSAKKLPESV